MSNLLQFDHQKRVVSLENLKAMCKHMSGMCHRYWVEKVTCRFAYVVYSNPNEYGSEHPMTILLPVYSAFPDWDKKQENPAVIMDIVRVTHDNLDGEGWQAFDPLMDCPTLWRNPETNEWHEEKKNAPHPVLCCCW